MQTKKNYEQLYIDFGQKGISPIICTECGMPYNPSIQEDDLQHQQYHNIIIDGIEYNVIIKNRFRNVKENCFY